jgi:hypothetical protein
MVTIHLIRIENNLVSKCHVIIIIIIIHTSTYLYALIYAEQEDDHQ